MGKSDVDIQAKKQRRPLGGWKNSSGGTLRRYQRRARFGSRPAAEPRRNGSRQTGRELSLPVTDDPDQPLAGRQVAFLVPELPHWYGPARSDLFARHLRSLGATVEVRGRREGLAGLDRFDVVFNHAMVVRCEQMERFAVQNSHVQVVHVNHSSIGYLEQMPSWLDHYIACCRSAMRNENVWCVSQDENRLHGIQPCRRIRHMSTPAHLFEPRAYRPVNTPANLVIGGRVNPVKNQLNAVIAARYLQTGGAIGPVSASKITTQLHLCCHPDNRMTEWLKLCRVTPVIHGKMPHGQWIEFLREEADVVLTPSYTESYCYVASESQQLGVPTVGTPNVRACDPKLAMNDANWVSEMVANVRKALQDYPKYTRRAAAYGRASANDQNRLYRRFMLDLFLESSVVRKQMGN